ncbi:hypothetical protein [Chelativorans sp. AA-79]|uniref:hypothetical protein n=1 Tax=Chelativorans sp. AA-79 TaxID=3028735 RepID=UPI0023F7DE3E|nr:hypothetical protein [Chelativorans sp. AA-79]WEX10307.1 hypothetical protein PVE73_04935 [Chelativorans sp. AA-79]
MATETRMICCPNCGGDGGWDGEFSPVHYGHWTACTYCEGTGNIEVDVEPITADDLDAARASFRTPIRSQPATEKPMA